MSDLQKSFVQAKLARLCPSINLHEWDEDEETEHGSARGEPGRETVKRAAANDGDDDNGDDDDGSPRSSSSTCTIKASPRPDSSSADPPAASAKRSPLAPLPWTDFFQHEVFLRRRDVDPEVVLHAYVTAPVGAAPLFVAHHGAGASGLSFAALTAEIRKLLPSAGVLSIDARGHGLTQASQPSDVPDLSLETLSADLAFVVGEVEQQMKWGSHPIILIGHSLGGAVVTHLALSETLAQSLLGYVVIDIVEGSAMEALCGMQTYLSTRPPSFPSIQSAIQWHIRTRSIRNVTSARVSVPAVLEQNNEDTLNPGAWVWHTDLMATKPYWEGWFSSLSEKFLKGRAGKLLLLAGTDRLDTELMIGQMQGKFAMQVFPDAGHFIHEDVPDRVAHAVVEFYKRNDGSLLVLPPKVADLLRAGKKV